jgi:hypothetical protein
MPMPSAQRSQLQGTGELFPKCNLEGVQRTQSFAGIRGVPEEQPPAAAGGEKTTVRTLPVKHTA